MNKAELKKAVLQQVRKVLKESKINSETFAVDPKLARATTKAAQALDQDVSVMGGSASKEQREALYAILRALKEIINTYPSFQATLEMIENVYLGVETLSEFRGFGKVVDGWEQVYQDAQMEKGSMGDLPHEPLWKKQGRSLYEMKKLVRESIREELKLS